MPGFYADGEYDIAGFIVGIVERAKVVDGRGIVPGDVLIGLPSAGLHTNGYSLARRVLFESAGLTVDSKLPELGTTVAEALLAPHRSYLQTVAPLLERGQVKGLAHITGGGITENLPRTLPEGCAAEVELKAWEIPPIFQVIARRGGIARDEMLRAFNMGIGLMIVCSAGDVNAVLEQTRSVEPGAAAIGRVIAGAPGVHYL